jgi:hypothetical protein
MHHCVGAAQLPTADAVAERAEVTAEECFQQALTIARRQEAKSLELRAAMSLARLWWQRGTASTGPRRRTACDAMADRLERPMRGLRRPPCCRTFHW